MSNVLVTGTGSGLGRRTAEVLAERGHTVVATLRDPDGKDSTAAETLVKSAAETTGEITVVPMDVTSDASVEAGVALALERVGHLDAVVNNAGYSIGGIAETITSEQLLAALDANTVGAHRVTRAVLPNLRANHSGLVVFISSAAGRLTGPGMGAYSATKFAIEGLAQAYRYELRLLGIDVSIVQPGMFPTNLGASARFGEATDRATDYAEVGPLAQRFMQGLGAAMASPQPPDPREVAEAIATLVEAPAGTRPDHVSVDRFALGEAAEAINAGAKGPQDKLLTDLGLGPVVG
jgi:NAD(P)-dependent dehydrogenase (short-subunit alcohol dehydrogenase family)